MAAGVVTRATATRTAATVVRAATTTITATGADTATAITGTTTPASTSRLASAPHARHHRLGGRAPLTAHHEFRLCAPPKRASPGPDLHPQGPAPLFSGALTRSCTGQCRR